jgi:CRISPR-associated protein Csd1
MILQALLAYYERKMLNPDPAQRLPAAGLEEKEIPFVLELASDGRLVQILDTRTQDGKKKVPRRFQVPQGVKKASGVAANLLWDTAEYVLGLDTKGKPERVGQQTVAFRQRVEQLLALTEDPGVTAVHRFLCGTPLDAAQQHPQWPDIAETNPLLSFRLAGDLELVPIRPGVLNRILAGADIQAEEGSYRLACLMTGQTTEPERLHNAIKGVWGAQTSGANIVSFNLDAFRSFGKEQGANAPVSPAAAFAYTTALNHLLAKGSQQRMQVGDASTVFWAQAEADTDMEDAFAALFTDVDDPDAHTEQVHALFDALQSGRFDGAAGQRRFYVLGLAPNAARISIRFWHAAPLHDIATEIRQWFDDLAMQRGPHDPEYPSLFRLLTSIALQGKADNIPPNLGGDVMRAILTGGPFPAQWLHAAVQRCRAERYVSYLRTCVIKACLNRQIRSTSRSQNPNPEEVYRPMLDQNNMHTGYRLGRLFATLEKIQEEASPGLNATIRERYFGAASSTPVAVFTTLLRLKNHHLAKLSSRGRAVNFEKLLAEIIGGIDAFPAHMPLADQGRFALGYYHQRQAFFTKAETETAAPTTAATTESN